MTTSAAAWVRPSGMSKAARPPSRSSNQRRLTPSTQRWLTKFFTLRSRSKMKTVISARDIEDLLSKGGDLRSLPADAIITPSARDLLRDLENRGSAKSNGAVA